MGLLAALIPAAAAMCAVGGSDGWSAGSVASAGLCKTTANSGFTGLDLTVNGTTTGVHGVASAEACCELCWSLSTQRSQPCRYWTFSAPAQTCHPKYGTKALEHREGITYGSIFPLPPPPPPYSGPQPNIVFLIDESTDGRTYNPDPDGTSAVYIPNIRKLQARGATFSSFYANSPVCAPSRTSMISGRHVHRVPHTHSGVPVNGAWNNAEGNPPDYDLKWLDVLSNASAPEDLTPYQLSPTFGKTDWTVGGHAVWNWLQCWTMYVRFPYNATNPAFRDPKQNGTGFAWSEQPDGGQCRVFGTVDPNASRVRTNEGDWGGVDRNVAWIRTKPEPFVAYQGMNVVHPPYTTSQYWLDKIDESKVDVPAWAPLEDLHPCDFQSSMLKGCVPPSGDSEEDNAAKVAFYSEERRRSVRRIYLAMIAEYDLMVGDYVAAVEETPGLADRTFFFLTSDHGDMRMEHQQFYKMVPWEASARVPLVVVGPGVKPNNVVTRPASLVDIYPTMLAISGFPLPRNHSGLDGFNLMPLLTGKGESDDERPDYIMSQGHMADNAISWYLLRQNEMKLIVYGTGAEHTPKLYNLTADPGESTNLASDAEFKPLVESMTATLREVLDFPAVSLDVANYSQLMFTQWYQKQNAKGTWKDWITTGSHPGPAGVDGVPGGPSGTAWPSDLVAGGVAAIERWLSEEPKVLPCRGVDWAPGMP